MLRTGDRDRSDTDNLISECGIGVGIDIEKKVTICIPMESPGQFLISYLFGRPSGTFIF